MLTCTTKFELCHILTTEPTSKDQSHLSGVRLLFETSGLNSNGWFQHTPGTYPSPPTNSLWRNLFHFGSLGMSGVCSKGGVFWDCLFFVSTVASLKNSFLWIKNEKRGKHFGKQISGLFHRFFPQGSLDVFFLITFWPSFFFKFTIMLNLTTLATWQTHHHWPHGICHVKNRKSFQQPKKAKNGHWCSVVLRVECSSWKFCFKHMFTI